MADYIGERVEIAVEDIEEVVAPSLEFSVFEMLDVLFAGDLARAERCLQTLLMGGQTCVGVFSMVVRQLRMLAHLALAQRAGGSTAAVEKALKLHPYAAKRACAQARALDAMRSCPSIARASRPIRRSSPANCATAKRCNTLC